VVRNMTKEIIIAVLVMALIYLYYQQNTQPKLDSNSQELQVLQQEVQHYQTLYQKRVQKDLAADQSNKISELTEKFQNLQTELAQKTEEFATFKTTAEQLEVNWQTEKQSLVGEKEQTKELLNKKIGDLETQLLNLVNTKLKGKKAAEKLLSDLETQ
jgi:type II secretory pathway pseudopilin PulG